MPEGKVYVGAADNDFVTWLGRDGDLGMGRDPAQADFGATVFPVAPGEEFHADDRRPGRRQPHVLLRPRRPTSSRSTTSPPSSAATSPTVTAGRTQDANDMAVDWAKDEVVHQVEKEIDTTAQEIEDIYDDGKDWVGDRVDDFSDLWRERLGWRP